MKGIWFLRDCIKLLVEGEFSYPVISPAVTNTYGLLLVQREIQIEAIQNGGLMTQNSDGFSILRH